MTNELKVKDKFFKEHNSMKIGFIGPKDIYEEQIKLDFKNARKISETEAKWNVALYYFTGEHCKSDYKRAFRWFINYISSPYKHNHDGEFTIGMMFHLGQGVRKKDDALACYWFEKGAFHGDKRCKEIIKDNAAFLKDLHS